MNGRLAEKVEVNLFPLILEKSMNTPPNVSEKNRFMISISGKRRSKFLHSKLVDYFEIFKKDLLLGYMEISKEEAVFIDNET